MVTLTLSTILYPYWAFLGLFTVFAVIDVWHMVRLGTYGMRNYLALFVFLAGIVVILWGTSQLLLDVVWAMPFGGMVDISFP